MERVQLHRGALTSLQQHVLELNNAAVTIYIVKSANLNYKYNSD
jgi:hypothetical protein